MTENSIDVGKIKKRDSKARSFWTYLESWKNIFKKEDNKQGIILVEEIQNKFLEFYPNKESFIQIIEGWEKEGDFPIWKDIDNDFVVEIWHKDAKETYKVPKENINAMLNVIRQLDIGIEYKCYAIAKKLGYEWKELWKERMGAYFPFYYIPLKILDKIGFISYGGNKKYIIRLK